MFTTLMNFLAYDLEEISAAVITNMPSMGAPCFRDFPDARMVIECTDIFAERPSGLSASQQKFSSNKYHITIKLMVGCSMNGEGDKFRLLCLRSPCKQQNDHLQ